MRNGFKAALYRRQLQLGLWQALANSYTAEICATAGFDWLLFDGEHAPNDIRSFLSQLQAVAAYPVHAVGRPPAAEPWLIKQYLDIGFSSLLVPMVDDAEQAASLVAATRYPPRGVRGVGAGIARVSRWNAITDYLQIADDEVCLLVQVETLRGLSNAKSIAAVDDVDGVFIGPADLSAAMGHRGQPSHPEVRAAIASAIRDIQSCGKPVGILATTPTLAQEYIDSGCTFVAVGTDVGLLANGARELLNRVRPQGKAASSAPGAY